MQKLYYGGSIITMEDDNKVADALLIEDGRIVYAGCFNTASRISKDARLVNLHGNTLMPAFIDAHSHITNTARNLYTVSLDDVKNFNEIIKKIRKYISDNKLTKEDVVFGTGYDHNFLDEKDHPKKDVLNQASTEIPIYINHVSGHMGCANDATLKLCGIDESTPDPAGGMIGRVGNSLEPSGYFEETATYPAGRIKSLLKTDIHSALTEIQELYLKNGITTVQDGGTNAKALGLLMEYSSQGLLKLDVVAYPVVQKGIGEIIRTYPDYVNKYRNRLKIGGYKIGLDGSPQAKTAWLTQPYNNSGSYYSYPIHTDQEVYDSIRVAIDDNMQLLAHCNGDAASDQYIRNYKKALTDSDNNKKHELRPVMIHCQTVRDDQLDEMVELNMIPSIFVGHTYYWGDVHMQNLGFYRGNRISPVRSALNRGLIFNFHQDTPVTKPLMLHSIWCAVNRVSKKGEIIGPDQRIDVYNAIKAVTINAAYMYSEEDKKGSLKAGKHADLIILDRNPLETPIMDIKDIRILETIKEGNTVWCLNHQSGDGSLIEP